MFSFLQRICRKFRHIRLSPIHVYCLHHVSTEFDDSMEECDWLSIDAFKSIILSMRRNRVTFVSMREAYRHITEDTVRIRKYATISFDDGYASLKGILPWLEEQRIPVTLFINGKYLDGCSFRDNPKEHYLSSDDLFKLTSPLVEIGSHGWEHNDATQCTTSDFLSSIERNIQLLSRHPRFIPFHAYTWGRHSTLYDSILYENRIIPVLMDGMKNYNEKKFIHRELLEHISPSNRSRF